MPNAEKGKRSESPKNPIHVGKRQWRPPIKGQSPGPEATTQEILGKGAPIVEGGILSRKLEPEEQLNFGRTRSPSIIHKVKDLGETTLEEKEETRGLEELLTAHELRTDSRIQGWSRRQAKKHRQKKLQGDVDNYVQSVSGKTEEEINKLRGFVYWVRGRVITPKLVNDFLEEQFLDDCESYRAIIKPFISFIGNKKNNNNF